MATSSLAALPLSNNPHIQRAANELMFLNLKYGEDAGSDEYGAEAGQILDDCCTRLGLSDDDDSLIETVNELAGKMTHQRAVNALIELTLDTAKFRENVPDAQRGIPDSEIPALFRLAINEQRNERECAVLECALTLFEQNPDKATRTAEQESFYASLGWSKDENGLRVQCDPQNVTVQ